jgi:hypothetical protein
LKIAEAQEDFRILAYLYVDKTGIATKGI